MENKAFISALSARLNISQPEAARLVRLLGDALAATGEELDAVSIPRFGTFETVKEDERVDTDLSSGRRVLLPPRIVMNFKAGAALRKAIMG